MDTGLRDRLAAIGSSSLHEAMGRKGALPSRIRTIAPDASMAGRAVTVACHPADNVTLLKAMDVAGEGDVLVVATGHHEAGYFGEVMATRCMARGIAGLVIDGGVRDVQRLREMGFPVFAANVCMAGTVKQTLGPINERLVIGGQIIEPGDFVRGDDDGVVIVPAASGAAVIEEAERRETDEAGKMAMLRDGQSLFELMGLNKRFPGA